MVFSKSDMLMLQSCLKDTNIILLSDEVYEHIVFDSNSHESASKYPDLASRSFVCASFGKTFHATGWKMGYCAAPAELMKEFQKIHEFNVFCVNHPFQRALAEYLKKPAHYLDLGPFYQEKRDLFLSAIKNSRFKFNPTQGTYFQLLDFSEISNESDIAFAERLGYVNCIMLFRKPAHGTKYRFRQLWQFGGYIVCRRLHSILVMVKITKKLW